MAPPFKFDVTILLNKEFETKRPSVHPLGLYRVVWLSVSGVQDKDGFKKEERTFCERFCVNFSKICKHSEKTNVYKTIDQ
jgi:hypothetical protein